MVEFNPLTFLSGPGERLADLLVALVWTTCQHLSFLGNVPVGYISGRIVPSSGAPPANPAPRPLARRVRSYVQQNLIREMKNLHMLKDKHSDGDGSRSQGGVWRCPTR